CKPDLAVGAARELDHDAVAGSSRMQELGRGDLQWHERRVEIMFDRHDGFTQQHGAGNDGIAGKMPLGRRMIGVENPLDHLRICSASEPRLAAIWLSDWRGSLPVSLRGKASTKCSGR